MKATGLTKFAGLLLGLHLLACISTLAQRPQDNAYWVATWNKGADGMTLTNGGLNCPCGVAIGPDGRIYVGDEGFSCVQVYLPDGTYSFSITNGFGEGEAFSQPRGMLTDSAGNLYVADAGKNCVFVFAGNGAFVRKIGGTTGSGDGELSGVIDVGVGQDGSVYVLENENSRVSVFSEDGSFQRKWGGHGRLDGQLFHPFSIAVMSDDLVFTCENDELGNWPNSWLKEFTKEGTWKSTSNMNGQSYMTRWGPASIRPDPGGYLNMVRSSFVIDRYWSSTWYSPEVTLYSSGEIQTAVGAEGSGYGEVGILTDYRSPCHAVGRDGTIVLSQRSTRSLWVYRIAFRHAPPVLRNAIPFPAVMRVQQRPGSPLVDVDYRVTDADHAVVHTAILVFKNGSQTLSNAISLPTLVEGTATNLGAGIPANATHRVTWNVGADWSVNLGQCRVVILARDSRPNLLDIHYLRLPPSDGMSALKISRSPLNQSDFMQVWWWLLATNDMTITVSSNRIYGASGGYNGRILCEDEKTTSDGLSCLLEKMSLRQATAAELQRARQGTLPSGTNPNQWPPVRVVGGRPLAVNEYGFDTGEWGEEACWVVPFD